MPFSSAEVLCRCLPEGASNARPCTSFVACSGGGRSRTVVTDLRATAGERHRGEGRVEQALEAFGSVAQIAPASPMPWVGRAVCLCLMHQRDAAEEACDRAIELQPDCKAAYLIKATLALVLRNDRAEAQNVLRTFRQQEQITRILHAPYLDRVWLTLWLALVTELRASEHGPEEILYRVLEDLRIGV